MDNSFIKQASERVKKDTPSFFKRLRKWAAYSTVILGAAAFTVKSLGAPIWIPAVIGGLDALCIGILGTSFLPKKDKLIEMAKNILLHTTLSDEQKDKLLDLLTKKD